MMEFWYLGLRGGQRFDSCLPGTFLLPVYADLTDKLVNILFDQSCKEAWNNWVSCRPLPLFACDSDMSFLLVYVGCCMKFLKSSAHTFLLDLHTPNLKGRNPISGQGSDSHGQNKTKSDTVICSEDWRSAMLEPTIEVAL